MKNKILTTGILLGLAVGANAAIIAINFDGNSNTNASGTAFGVAAANWNNLNGGAGGPTSVTADDGVSTASITWSNGGEWSSGAATTGDDSVLKGYLDDPNGGGLNPVVSITGMNAISTGTYSVTLLYTTDSAAGVFDAGTVNTAAADTVTALTPAGGASQSQLFNAVSGDTISIDIGDDNRGNGRATLAGIQVDFTPVPEPTSTALLGLGGLALILRRRK